MITERRPLSPLGERVDRTGVFSSRGGPGEGVALEQVEGQTSLTNLRLRTLVEHKFLPKHAPSQA